MACGGELAERVVVAHDNNNNTHNNDVDLFSPPLHSPPFACTPNTKHNTTNNNTPSRVRSVRPPLPLYPVDKINNKNNKNTDNNTTNTTTTTNNNNNVVTAVFTDTCADRHTPCRQHVWSSSAVTVKLIFFDGAKASARTTSAARADDTAACFAAAVLATVLCVAATSVLAALLVTLLAVPAAAWPRAHHPARRRRLCARRQLRAALFACGVHAGRPRARLRADELILPHGPGILRETWYAVRAIEATLAARRWALPRERRTVAADVATTTEPTEPPQGQPPRLHAQRRRSQLRRTVRRELVAAAAPQRRDAAAGRATTTPPPPPPEPSAAPAPPAPAAPSPAAPRPTAVAAPRPVRPVAPPRQTASAARREATARIAAAAPRPRTVVPVAMPAPPTEQRAVAPGTADACGPAEPAGAHVVRLPTDQLPGTIHYCGNVTVITLGDNDDLLERALTAPRRQKRRMKFGESELDVDGGGICAEFATRAAAPTPAAVPVGDTEPTLALAMAHFARLSREGVEPNPGPTPPFGDAVVQRWVDRRATPFNSALAEQVRLARARRAAATGGASAVAVGNATAATPPPVRPGSDARRDAAFRRFMQCPGATPFDPAMAERVRLARAAEAAAAASATDMTPVYAALAERTRRDRAAAAAIAAAAVTPLRTAAAAPPPTTRAPTAATASESPPEELVVIVPPRRVPGAGCARTPAAVVPPGAPRRSVSADAAASPTRGLAAPRSSSSPARVRLPDGSRASLGVDAASPDEMVDRGVVAALNRVLARLAAEPSSACSAPLFAPPRSRRPTAAAVESPPPRRSASRLEDADDEVSDWGVSDQRKYCTGDDAEDRDGCDVWYFAVRGIVLDDPAAATAAVERALTAARARPPLPEPPLSCAADLAAAAFARLLCQGIEPNPGPPRPSDRQRRLADARAEADDPTTRTHEERRAHYEVLRHASQQLLWKAKRGDIVYLRERDESQSPPVVRVLAVTLEAPLDSKTFTVRPTCCGAVRERKILLRPWQCAAVDVATKTPIPSYVFPADPDGAKEEEELVTYLNVSRTPIAVSAADKRVIWEQRTLGAGTHFDGEAIRTERAPLTERMAHILAAEVAGIVAAYPAARVDGVNTTATWHRLLNVPKTRLRGLAGSAHQRTRHAFASAQLACGTDAYLVQTTSIAPEAAAQQSHADDPDAKHVLRAKRLATQGYLSKASAALEARDVGDQDEATRLRNLRSLHPDGDAPSLRYPDGGRLQDVPPAARAVLQPPTASEFTQLVRGSISGCSPGATGWTEELLFALCEHNETVARVVGLMVRDLACGLVAPDVVDRLNACNLVGVPKPDGGTRPIALSELFLKLASKLALHHDSARLAAIFGDIQYGVARPNGAETIVHETRQFVRNMGPTACAAAVDLSNAFNAIEREIIWEMVRDLPALRNLFAVEYAGPSLLRVVGTHQTIASRRGTRQGTTAGPAFFCLAFHPALLAAAAVPGVRVRAYMDDVTILADSLEACRDAVEAIRQHCARLGVAINAKKSELLTRGNPPDWLCPGFRRVEVLKVLGASVGFTDEEERAHLLERSGSKFATWFRRVRKCFGPYATALLATCGVPKAGFLMRVHHPAVVQPLLKEFDDNIEGVWSGWAQCEVDEATRTLAHLPVKLGGLGFTRMQQIANAAHESSVDAAFAGRDGASVLKQAARVLPINMALAKYVDDCGPQLKRLRELNCQPGTATILRDPTVRCEPGAFSAALRWHLGAPLKNTPEQVECPGCHTTFERRAFLFHGGSCARVPGCNVSTAHASVKKAFAQLCHDSRVQCESAEPRDLRNTVCPGCKTELVEARWADHAKACKQFNLLTMQAPRGSGPDVRFYPPSRGTDTQHDATVIDVTHVSLMAPSHGGSPGREFASREQSKVLKYGAACAAANTRLVVGAMSENGILSRAFGTVVDDLALHSGMQAHEARKRIQAAVQVGHGRALANAERRAGLAYVPRRAVAAAAALTTRALDADSSGAATSAPWLLAPADDPCNRATSVVPASVIAPIPTRNVAPAARPRPAPSPSPPPVGPPPASTAPSADAGPSAVQSPPPAPRAATADAARARSPEAVAPAPSTRPLRFGRSPIMARPGDSLAVYWSDVGALRQRAFAFLLANPAASSVINALRSGFTGHYAGRALLRALAGGELEGQTIDNIRATLVALRLVTERGIVVDGCAALPTEAAREAEASAARVGSDAAGAAPSSSAQLSAATTALAPVYQTTQPSEAANAATEDPPLPDFDEST